MVCFVCKIVKPPSSPPVAFKFYVKKYYILKFNHLVSSLLNIFMQASTGAVWRYSVLMFLVVTNLNGKALLHRVTSYQICTLSK